MIYPELHEIQKLILRKKVGRVNFYDREQKNYSF